MDAPYNEKGGKMRSSKILFLAILIQLTSLTQLYGAALLELYGAPDSINPHSARIFAPGPEAAYFNPALLIGQKDSLNIGFSVLVQALKIGYNDKDSGFDVPPEVYLVNSDTFHKGEANLTLEQRRYTPIPTADLMSSRGSSTPEGYDMYVVVGGTKELFDIKKSFFFAIGGYAMLPTSQVSGQGPFYSDEREAYFTNSLHYELLGDRLDSFQAAFSIAGGDKKFFAIGAGINLGISADSSINVYVPNANKAQLLLFNPPIAVHTLVSPEFGFVITPIENLKIAGTTHLPAVNFNVDINVDIQIWNWPYAADPNDPTKKQKYITSGLGTTYGWDPLRCALAASYDIPIKNKYKLGLMATGIWNHWTPYIDRNAETPFDKWHDTISGSFGTNLKSESRELGLDFWYEPSPVPDQSGRSNYVDNSRLGISGGWTEFFKISNITIAAGVNAQLQYLIKRSVTKTRTELTGTQPEGTYPVVDDFPESPDLQGQTIPTSVGFQTNNPGFPGFSSSGFLVGSGLFVKVLF